MENKSYNWKFASVGGEVRVKITSGEDIAHLGELDKKMWTVLSSPVQGLEFDQKFLDLLDTNKDGKIRTEEVIAAGKYVIGFGSNVEDIRATSPYSLSKPHTVKCHDVMKPNMQL